MKDEIKEILDITETADYKRLSVDEIIVIKDYIINLQKENKQTKLLKELYKLRNEKAIKILNEGLEELDVRDRSKVYSEEYLENAIDVLKGSNK